jgi:hypothetical protein
MMTMVRRFVVLAAIMLWQGGFTFYGAFVVPIGSEILGSHQKQGWITRSVTDYLNLTGAVALGVWAWDIGKTRDASLWRWRLRWGLWLVLVLTLGLLAWLHVWLDEFLDFETFCILNREQFRYLHGWYLNISTVQWGGSLVLLATTLLAWRCEDTRKS